MSVSKSYYVTGMTCGHCVRAVTEELSTLAGVSNVDVDLREGDKTLVTVTSAAPISDDVVAAAIDEAGYDFAGPA